MKTDTKIAIVISAVAILIFAAAINFSGLMTAELYIHPGGTTNAAPGQTLNFDIVYYNQFATGYYFQTEVWKLPQCGALTGTFIQKSSSKYVQPGKYIEDTISFSAPTTPGSYVFSFINYYGTTSPPQTWDQEVCTTIVVSSATPTPDDTEPPTDLCKNIQCDEECDGKLSLSGGICNSKTGICSYAKSYVDGSCGYVAGTPIPTYTTPTPPPGTGGDNDTVSNDLIYAILIVAGSLIFALYMITRPVGKKKGGK